MFLNRISSFSGNEERYKESATLPELPDIESKRGEVVTNCGHTSLNHLLSPYFPPDDPC